MLPSNWVKGTSSSIILIYLTYSKILKYLHIETEAERVKVKEKEKEKEREREIKNKKYKSEI